MMEFSIHALLAESDGVLHMDRWLAGLFLSTLSLRRATALSLPFGAVWIVFYPRSPCGERLLVWCSFGGACVFLSTLSLRRATRGISSGIAETAIFYPRSPCGERPFRLRSFLDLVLFLSTLSLRRATLGNVEVELPMWNFYPRSPCGERRSGHPENHPSYAISIHALLAESDSKPKDLKSRRMVFLSTLSLRRATISPPNLSSISDISIHALLAESDADKHAQQPTQQGFLSTLSLRRATSIPL